MAAAEAISETVGRAQIFLIGSRARGKATALSDCDISVVLSTYKVPLAGRQLQVVGEKLSKAFGVPVSVNPVPRLLYNGARHNLYILKIKQEGILLNLEAPHVGKEKAKRVANCRASPFPQFVRWDTSSSRAHHAQVSYLLSAVHTLLGGVTPENLLKGNLNSDGNQAVWKARIQAAQSFLLTIGKYVIDEEEALRLAEQQSLIPAVTSGIPGFSVLRLRLLEALGVSPIGSSRMRSMGRDLQYAMLSSLRGHRRWRVLGHEKGIEGRLASASVHLLESLTGEQPTGYNPASVDRARLILPSWLRPRSHEYVVLRDLVLAEWSSAQPLVSVI